MPEFAYKARNAEGGLVEGVLNCPDRGIAIRQIEQQNCIPIRIDAVTTATPVAVAALHSSASVRTDTLRSRCCPLSCCGSRCSISNLPNLRFDFRPNGAATFRVEAKDTDGKVYRREWPAGASEM